MADAFTPENGEGLASANSQVSVEDADAYFALRHNATWQQASLEAKQGALVDATDWIIERYGAKFAGITLTPEQAMPFPRAFAGADIGVPRAVVKAVCALAIEVIEGRPLWNNPDPAEATLIERTTGPLTRKFQPANLEKRGSTQREFARVVQLLAPFLPTEHIGILRTRRV